MNILDGPRDPYLRFLYKYRRPAVMTNVGFGEGFSSIHGKVQTVLSFFILYICLFYLGTPQSDIETHVQRVDCNLRGPKA
jgi:hypothetical protein